MPGLIDDDGSIAPRTAHASFSPASAKQRLLTTPIQDLQVGMRVIGRNPLPGDAERDIPEPDADRWRLVKVRSEDSTGQLTEIQLLRPLEWIESNGTQPGSEIWLELPDMDMSGPVEVIAVEACPEIEDGQGSVITGTFQHLSNDLVNVHIDGQAEPIGATSQHPFWSETQQAFIPASQLQIGEEVRTAYGSPVQVTSITPRAGPETVYGLEVFGEHVYHVSQQGLLVHNASNQLPAKKGPQSDWTSTQAKPTGAAFDPSYTSRNSARLRKNMGLGVGDGDAHHMVASTHRRAEKARSILDFYQIDVNSRAVGAELSQSLHHGRGLHSFAGIDEITRRLEDAVDQAGGMSTNTTQWRQGKANVLWELRELHRNLKDPNFRL